MVDAIGDSVRQRRITKTAVATGRTKRGGSRFDHHHVATGITLDRLQGGPETCVPAANNQQITIRIRGQRPALSIKARTIKPKHLGLGVAQRGMSHHKITGSNDRGANTPTSAVG